MLKQMFSHVSLRFHSELLLALGATLEDDLTFDGSINWR